MILNPAFPDSELSRLKKQIASGIQAEKNSPVQLALRVVPNLIYGEGHAYNMPLTGTGTEESVASIGRDDLVQFHDTWFRPNNATLVVVGDTTLAEIQPKLEGLFANWQPKDVPEKNIGAAKTIDGEQVYIIDRPDAEQSVIIAAEVVPPTNNEDEFALQAMNGVLGGAFSSRVNMNLREDKSWAYGAYTFVLGGAGPRPFIGYAPVQTDKTAPSMQELRNEMVAITSTRPPEDEELARVMDENTLTPAGQLGDGRRGRGFAVADGALRLRRRLLGRVRRAHARARARGRHGGGRRVRAAGQARVGRGRRSEEDRAGGTRARVRQAHLPRRKRQRNRGAVARMGSEYFSRRTLARKSTLTPF